MGSFTCAKKQGQVRQRFKQPGLVEGVPAHGREVGKRWSLRSLPTQTILRFYENLNKGLNRWDRKLLPEGR